MLLPGVFVTIICGTEILHNNIPRRWRALFVDQALGQPSVVVDRSRPEKTAEDVSATVSRVAQTLTLRRSGGKDVASSVGDGRGMFGVVWVCPVKFKVSHPFHRNK